ncbi:unnamed protein product [Aphanomyces euteiches]|uniref:Sister chromatid cohesion protein DCC1 n=1 Tax=Aphanomyces euteiches TaxID=100861 RepID=A0A6G0WSB3_9STRA|nr:hypothetical protein Ae201684_012332 [Aphanomyces euteiches]KAH9096690.1 hypothetical protein Ae201684P_013356 [Aphanomyces euteiches]KAH9157231.1 hypothetical protein AeRB84_000906 [Aphanomyces euteiches]
MSAAAEVVFGDDYDEDGFKLVELPEDVCSALTSGEQVYIVGDAAQRAVLCTPTQSFNLVKEDQSNLRLLVDSTTWDDAASEAPVVIRGCSVYHYELTEKPLDVSQLKALLMETPWTKEWCLMTRRSDSPIKKKKRSNLYTLDELMDRLQHSSHEVRQILQQLHAIEIDGFWRIVDPAYAQDVMNQVLDVFVQQDWDFDRTLTVDELESHLSITPAILAHCLRNYSSSIADDGSFSLDPVKIATFQAISLFDERKEWPVDEFMEKWGFRVPDGVSIDASMLRGLAILRQDTLVYFPEDRLSIDAKTRFQEIFSFQPKWTLAQLEPYLTQLISGKMTQASLLLKYTRASRVLNSTERLYSKR